MHLGLAHALPGGKETTYRFTQHVSTEKPPCDGYPPGLQGHSEEVPALVECILVQRGKRIKDTYLLIMYPVTMNAVKKERAGTENHTGKETFYRWSVRTHRYFS